jgi:hypothetical protein
MVVNTEPTFRENWSRQKRFQAELLLRLIRNRNEVEKQENTLGNRDFFF